MPQILSSQPFKPRLNKSNVRQKKYLMYLSFILLTMLNLGVFCATDEANSQIEVQILPSSPALGDTISVKIKKLEGAKKPPKVFFDKSKLPIFNLSGFYYRSLIPISANLKPGKHELEVFYKGLGKKVDLTIQKTKYPIENLTLRKEVASLTASRLERQLVVKAINTQSDLKLWRGKFALPSSGKMSTIYGIKRRVNGVIDPDYFHKGLDFAAGEGSNIIAPEGGKIILVGQEPNGFRANGNCIFIDHGHGVISGYLHLSKLLVMEGNLVNKGQIIGKVGSTGIASGPHLHWGVYVLGKTVDPLVWTRTTIE